MAGRKNKRRKGRTSGTTYGLYAKNFPRPVQWKLDQDYLSQLSDKERQWLAQFHDEFYGGSFGDEPLHNSVELRRECYSHKNSANADAYEIHRVSGRLFGEEEMPELDRGEQDPRDLPAYLDTPEYREARQEYRKHLPKDRKAKVNETPEMQAAREKLRRLVREALVREGK